MQVVRARCPFRDRCPPAERSGPSPFQVVWHQYVAFPATVVIDVLLINLIDGTQSHVDPAGMLLNNRDFN
jgi:hypothetical protein